MPGFIFGEQHFMKLLAGPDADLLDDSFRGHRLSQVDEPHAGDLWDEDLSSGHGFNGFQNEADALIERDPETRHAGIGNGDAPAFSLIAEQGDHAAAASNHVAVA